MAVLRRQTRIAIQNMSAHWGSCALLPVCLVAYLLAGSEATAGNTRLCKQTGAALYLTGWKAATRGQLDLCHARQVDRG